VTDLVTSERAISFGHFRLVPAQRLLLEDDNPVRVGSRAFDILTALVERPGELVGKEELIARVWRGTFVEEGNLKFQVGGLRRALGDGRGGRRYIATSPGQGYSLCRAGHRRRSVDARGRGAVTRADAATS
jgi:DNA-binding winged helix-turn-helix (wHTH) protein